jgi:alpha-L-fucosidase
MSRPTALRTLLHPVFLTLLLLALLPRLAAAQSGPPVTPEIVAAAAAAKTPVAPGPVQPTWDSIRANYSVPQWFIDAKFGITMHWGLFSVPAYHNEWYEKYMYSAAPSAGVDHSFAGWHAQNFGPPDNFGYKDFIPLFTAKDFNADDVAELVKESGAKYFAPTVEHHDGFSLWNSATNPFNAFNMGPHRDLVGEMAVATRKVGLKFGVASHNIEHYTFIHPPPGVKTDLDDPKFANFYWTNHSDARLQEFLQDWVLKSMELIDQYQPDIFWYDNGINSRDYDPLKLKVAAYYYNRALQWHKPVTLLTKDSAFLAGSVLEFEKLNPRGPTQILKGIWDAEEPIGSTWGYSTANPVETFRGAGSVINELCTILSMNGNLLLNLSPTGTGAINDAQRTALKEVGKWLAVNGEAVYGTHNWIVDGEGFTPLPPRSPQMRRPEAAAAAAMEQGPTAGVAAPGTATPRPPRAPNADVSAQGPKPVVYRFTVKGENLYAIAQSWPGDTAVITSLAKGKLLDGQLPQGKIKTVTLLGSPGKLKFTQDAEGLKIKLPAERPCDYAFAFKITGLKMNPAGPPVPAVMADLR